MKVNRNKLFSIGLALIVVIIVLLVIVGPSGKTLSAYSKGDVRSSPLFESSLARAILELEGKGKVYSDGMAADKCDLTPECYSDNVVVVQATIGSCPTMSGATACGPCPTMSGATACGPCPTSGPTCGTTCSGHTCPPCSFPTIDTFTCGVTCSGLTCPPCSIPTIDTATCGTTCPPCTIPTVDPPCPTMSGATACGPCPTSGPTCGTTCSGHTCPPCSFPTIDTFTCGVTCSGLTCPPCSIPTIDTATCRATCTACSSTKILKREQISPGSQSSVEAQNGQLVLDFPQGAVTNETEVIITAELLSDAPPSPSGFKATSIYFSIEGPDSLAKEATITVKYSDGEVATAGGDPHRLALARYDEETAEWEVLPTTVDTTEKTLSATTNHLSKWMVLAKVSPYSILGLIWWAWIAIGVVIILIAGFVIGYGSARR